MARSAGYVRFNEKDEGRYLGPSSGIAVRYDPWHLMVFRVPDMVVV